MVMNKFFNKLNKDTSKFFNKSSKEIKMLGKGAKAFGSQVGGALGSAGGEVAKVASQLEKASAGTPISAIAHKVATGAGAVQSSGKAIKALSKGNVKEAVKLGRKAESGIMNVV